MKRDRRTTSELRMEKNRLMQTFQAAGGRGVDEAEGIDDITRELQLRAVEARPVGKRALRRALKKISDYLGDDEEKDWRNQNPHDVALKDHVYGAVVVVDAWLKEQRRR